MSLRARLHRIVLSSPARNLLLTEPKFVVVGTGRSGTRYISKVLTAAGLKTGHEDWWNPHGRRVRTRLIGDASWCALFNLERYEGHVFHQIRDPMKVVSSLATTELNPLWPGKENELYYSWRMRNIDLSGEPLIDAMATVVRWVKESERCSEWTYRVEDIDEGIILELASRAGIKASREAVRSALQTVPTDTNQRLIQVSPGETCPTSNSSMSSWRFRLDTATADWWSAKRRVVIVRMRWHPPTIAYVKRRTAEGLTKKDIIRCLKRYVAREVYQLLPEPAIQPDTDRFPEAA